MDFKSIIGHCKKYDKYMGVQVVPGFLGKTKVVGTYRMSCKPFDSEVKVTNLVLKDPCPSCGSSKLSGCSHPSNTCNGIMNKYCPSCSNFEIDNTKTKGNISQYGDFAGQNEIEGEKDIYGNTLGNQADLGRDGAFIGKKVVVIWLCPDIQPQGSSGSISKTNIINSLASKGFVVDFTECLNTVITPYELEAKLKDACQLWIISGHRKRLTSAHEDIIVDFFNKGRGLYIWGDNSPYYADINDITKKLFGVTMIGDYYGDKVLGISSGPGKPGIIKGHLISTGIANFYEGITIANVYTSSSVKPLVYNSKGEVVTAYYEEDGKKCIIDGGFTRLFYKWNTAGTDRFVKNCAVWLANVERFSAEY